MREFEQSTPGQDKTSNTRADSFQTGSEHAPQRQPVVSPDRGTSGPRPQVESLGWVSKADFQAERRRSALQSMDVSTPTSREKIIKRAEGIRLSALFPGDTPGLLQAHPDVDDMFRDEMVKGFTEYASGPTVTGADVATAYEEAVYIVARKTASYVKTVMFHVYDKALDHFGVPIAPEVVDRVEDPELAEVYRKRAAAWVENAEQVETET